MRLAAVNPTSSLWRDLYPQALHTYQLALARSEAERDNPRAAQQFDLARQDLDIILQNIRRERDIHRPLPPYRKESRR